MSGSCAPRGPLRASVSALAVMLMLVAAPAQAQNQGAPGATVRVDPGSGGVIFEPISNLPRFEQIVLNFEPQPPRFVFGVRLGLVPGLGCQAQSAQNEPPTVLAVCSVLPGRTEIHYRVILGPGRNHAVVGESVPVLPGANRIKGGKAGDRIEGGQSDEKIDSGKGKDNVNPGPGSDDANLGPGNDKANTRDGQPDTLNGGKGDDSATVDKKVDKVKNVEVVRRR